MSLNSSNSIPGPPALEVDAQPPPPPPFSFSFKHTDADKLSKFNRRLASESRENPSAVVVSDISQCPSPHLSLQRQSSTVSTVETDRIGGQLSLSLLGSVFENSSAANESSTTNITKELTDLTASVNTAKESEPESSKLVKDHLSKLDNDASSNIVSNKRPQLTLSSLMSQSEQQQLQGPTLKREDNLDLESEARSSDLDFNSPREKLQQTDSLSVNSNSNMFNFAAPSGAGTLIEASKESQSQLSIIRVGGPGQPQDDISESITNSLDPIYGPARKKGKKKRKLDAFSNNISTATSLTSYNPSLSLRVSDIKLPDIARQAPCSPIFRPHRSQHPTEDEIRLNEENMEKLEKLKCQDLESDSKDNASKDNDSKDNNSKDKFDSKDNDSKKRVRSPSRRSSVKSESEDEESEEDSNEFAPGFF